MGRKASRHSFYVIKEEERKKLIAEYILDHGSDETKIRDVVLTDSNFSTVQTLLTNFSE